MLVERCTLLPQTVLLGPCLLQRLFRFIGIYLQISRKWMVKTATQWARLLRLQLLAMRGELSNFQLLLPNQFFIFYRR